MKTGNIASKQKWLEARLALLEKEKAHSRARDELTRARRAMLWVKVDKHYEFDGSDGKRTLDDLFQGKNQLITYHFMFDPAWDAGCKSCSFIADHYDPSVVHIAHRDVALVTVSRAPLEKLEAFKKRMGWNFEWVSSESSDFNRDFHVTFTDEELDGEAYYNFRKQRFPVREAPGISVFARGDDGAIYHTYSAYARGLETFMGAYYLLDIVPKGRDEDDLPHGMDWLRLKDSYDEAG